MYVAALCGAYVGRAIYSLTVLYELCWHVPNHMDMKGWYGGCLKGSRLEIVQLGYNYAVHKLSHGESHCNVVPIVFDRRKGL